MKKISNNKVLYFIVQCITNTLFAMILWPLLDMFFRTVFEKKEFVYSISEHIFGPIVYGIVLTILLTVMKKKTSNK